MKAISNFTLLILLVVKFGYSQQKLEWSYSVLSNLDYLDNSPKIKMSNDENLIVVSNFDSSANNKDILIVKCDLEGNLIWQKIYSAINGYNDLISDYIIDSDNFIYIVGETYIDPLNSELLLLKYNSNGDLIWRYSYAGSVQRKNAGTAIALDQIGNLFITGQSTIDTFNNRKCITLKIDTGGNLIWKDLQGDSPGQSVGHKIKILNDTIKVFGYYGHQSLSTNKYIVIDYDGNGNVRSYKEQSIDRPPYVFYIDDFGSMYLGYGAQEKFKISKIHPNGNLAWSDVIPTNLTLGSTGDAVKSILVDSLGNVYATGMHFGNLTNSEFLTVKYSSSGVRLWNKRFTNNREYSADIPRNMVLDKNLNVYVFGQSIITVNQDSTVNFIMVKYDSNGNEDGNIFFDRTISDNFNALSALLDDNYNIYIAGVAYNLVSISGNNSSYTTTLKYSDINYYLSMQKNKEECEEIIIYPNPFINNINVKLNNWSNTYSLKIFDNVGKQIYSVSQPFFENINVIFPFDIECGQYIVVLHNNDVIIKKKILKIN